VLDNSETSRNFEGSFRLLSFGENMINKFAEKMDVLICDAAAIVWLVRCSR
jgi:hypothetical protein